MKHKRQNRVVLSLLAIITLLVSSCSSSSVDKDQKAADALVGGYVVKGLFEAKKGVCTVQAFNKNVGMLDQGGKIKADINKQGRIVFEEALPKADFYDITCNGKFTNEKTGSTDGPIKLRSFVSQEQGVHNINLFTDMLYDTLKNAAKDQTITDDYKTVVEKSSQALVKAFNLPSSEVKKVKDVSLLDPIHIATKADLILYAIGLRSLTSSQAGDTIQTRIAHNRPTISNYIQRKDLVINNLNNLPDLDEKSLQKIVKKETETGIKLDSEVFKAKLVNYDVFILDTSKLTFSICSEVLSASSSCTTKIFPTFPDNNILNFQLVGLQDIGIKYDEGYVQGMVAGGRLDYYITYQAKVGDLAMPLSGVTNEDLFRGSDISKAHGIIVSVCEGSLSTKTAATAVNPCGVTDKVPVAQFEIQVTIASEATGGYTTTALDTSKLHFYTCPDKTVGGFAACTEHTPSTFPTDNLVNLQLVGEQDIYINYDLGFVRGDTAEAGYVVYLSKDGTIKDIPELRHRDHDGYLDGQTVIDKGVIVSVCLHTSAGWEEKSKVSLTNPCGFAGRNPVAQFELNATKSAAQGATAVLKASCTGGTNCAVTCLCPNCQCTHTHTDQTSTATQTISYTTTALDTSKLHFYTCPDKTVGGFAACTDHTPSSFPSNNIIDLPLKGDQDIYINYDLGFVSGDTADVGYVVYLSKDGTIKDIPNTIGTRNKNDGYLNGQDVVDKGVIVSVCLRTSAGWPEESKVSLTNLCGFAGRNPVAQFELNATKYHEI